MPTLEEKMRGTVEFRSYIPDEQREEYEEERNESLKRVRDQEDEVKQVERSIAEGEEIGRTADDTEEQERRRARSKNLIRAAEERRKVNKRRFPQSQPADRADPFVFVPPQTPQPPPPAHLLPINTFDEADVDMAIDDGEEGTAAAKAMSESVFSRQDIKNPVLYRLAYYGDGFDPSTAGTMLWNEEEQRSAISEQRDLDPMRHFKSNSSRRSRRACSLIMDCVKGRKGEGGMTQDDMKDLLESSCDLKERSATDEKLRTPKRGEEHCDRHVDCFGGPYHERQCGSDTECEANFWDDIILRECLNDEETLELSEHGTLPEERRMCERCQRSQEGDAFIQMRSECQWRPIRCQLTRSYVETDVEAEQYVDTQTFCSGQVDFLGTPGPIPIEIGLYYEKYEDKAQGVTYNLQRGYERPKDLADRNPETDF